MKMLTRVSPDSLEIAKMESVVRENRENSLCMHVQSLVYGT
jgi:hypothetical protein